MENELQRCFVQNFILKLVDMKQNFFCYDVNL